MIDQFCNSLRRPEVNMVKQVMAPIRNRGIGENTEERYGRLL